MFLLASLLQALTFLFFGSNGCAEFSEISYEDTALVTTLLSGKCQLETRAKEGIAAAALWFVCWLRCAPIGKYGNTIHSSHSAIWKYICGERRIVQQFIEKEESQVSVHKMNGKQENQGSAQSYKISQDINANLKNIESLQESTDHVVHRNSDLWRGMTNENDSDM